MRFVIGAQPWSITTDQGYLESDEIIGTQEHCYALIYTKSVEFEDDDKYCIAVASNVQEARKLLETRFEYVCSHNETMLFKKRK